MNFPKQRLILQASSFLVLFLGLLNFALAEGTERSCPDGAHPKSSSEIEKIMQHEPFEVWRVKQLGGATGALRVDAHFPESGFCFRMKWKPAPEGGFSKMGNNSPRKEVAAYKLQKLFLNPEEYVVPITVLRAFSVDEYKALLKNGNPKIAEVKKARKNKIHRTFSEANSVVVALSFWIENVRPTSMDPIETFFTLPAPQYQQYTKAFGDFFTLTYLIDHRDPNPGNFLADAAALPQRFYSVDNGLSLFPYAPPNSSSEDSIHAGRPHPPRGIARKVIPTLPSRFVDRLKAISEEDIESLGVVAGFGINDQKLLEPLPEALFSGQSDRVRKGSQIIDGRNTKVIEFGLDYKELNVIRLSLKSLIKDWEKAQR